MPTNTVVEWSSDWPLLFNPQDSNQTSVSSPLLRVPPTSLQFQGIRFKEKWVDYSFSTEKAYSSEQRSLSERGREREGVRISRVHFR